MDLKAVTYLILKAFFCFKKDCRAFSVPFNPFRRPCYFSFLNNQSNEPEITNGKSILTNRKKKPKQ